MSTSADDRPDGTRTEQRALTFTVQVTNTRREVLFRGRITAANSNIARRRAIRQVIDRHGGAPGQYKGRVRRVHEREASVESPMAGSQAVPPGSELAHAHATESPGASVPSGRRAVAPRTWSGIMALVPADPLAPPVAHVHLHASLVHGLLDALEIPSSVTTLGLSDAERLEQWANGCGHTDGRRAAVARLVANVIRLSGPIALRRAPTPPVGFWEVAGR